MPAIAGEDAAVIHDLCLSDVGARAFCPLILHCIQVLGYCWIANTPSEIHVIRCRYEVAVLSMMSVTSNFFPVVALLSSSKCQLREVSFRITFHTMELISMDISYPRLQ